MAQPIINIKSLIDKVIIINADGKSVEEIQQAVETALKNAIKSVQANKYPYANEPLPSRANPESKGSCAMG